MISIISPAKTLDFESQYEVDFTQPRFPTQTERLVRVMRKKKEKHLQQLMSVSENIAKLNVDRFQNFQHTQDAEIGRPAMLAFKGDVYIGLEAESLSTEDLNYAQANLRILSGLYGLLRPFDIIEPYRLEMGTKLQVGKYKNLYAFWGKKIADQLYKDLKEQGSDTLINLASNEYFKSVPRKDFKARIIDVEFKDFKNDQYKVISFFAKKARGMMSRYIIQNKIEDVEGLKGFESEGYYYDPKESTEDKLAFKRG